MHRRAFRFALSFSLGWLATVFTAIPTLGAEQITFFYPPFGEFSIAIKDLEIFAKEGKVTEDFAFYARRANPAQLTALRDLLQRRFDVSPVTVSQFTYSPLGEDALRGLGRILRTESNQNSFYALRAAFILAASDREGLTVMNVLRQFPLPTINLDIRRSLKLVEKASELYKKKELIVAAIKQQEVTVAANPAVFSALPDLQQLGQMKWRKETLSVNHPQRNRSFPADIYLPQGISAPAPVIVISHGLASDRNTFAYLAQHLATYGFAVAVPEHVSSSSNEIEHFLSGFSRPRDGPAEFLNRSLDVKYLLDELERKSQSDPAWKGQMNLQQVGAIGQSWGGYTVLALAGAKLNFDLLRQECNLTERSNPFNLSVLLQCRAAELPPANYNLQDQRVKAVLAINPLGSILFGQQGLSQVQIPLMTIAGTNDIFAPPVAEQIRPFTWLTTPNKYLVLMSDGTHFSCLGGESKGALPVPVKLIGPDPALARPSVEVLSTAFFKTYLANRPDYRIYLSQSYIEGISQKPFTLSIVQSLTDLQHDYPDAFFDKPIPHR